MADATADARQQVVAARRNAERELDALGSSTRAALDIPAKVRRHPVETVGLASGLAFLVLGGPKRIAKTVERRFFPERADRPKGLLPKDIDKSLRHLPAEDRPNVKAHLERDFASYLQKEHTKEPPNARQSVWKTYDMLLGIVGAAAARELTKKLFAIPQETKVEAIKEEGEARAEAHEQVAAAKDKSARAG
jgi:hypothetical protein